MDWCALIHSTARHGLSPIDPTRFLPIPGNAGTNGMAPSMLLGASYLPDSELNQIGPTEDDVFLLWLKPGASTAGAVELLERHAKEIGGGQLFYGESIEPLFRKPGERSSTTPADIHLSHQEICHQKPKSPVNAAAGPTTNH